MATTYDVIVVGAGVVGSATAYQLAKDGYKTLLLEQFSLGHNRGSSHGHSRITRKAYEQDFYVRMMVQAYQKWEQLERECQQQLYVQCGLLNLGKPDEGLIPSVKTALDVIQSPYEILSPSEISGRYPTIRVGEDFVGLFDPEGGILKADKCLQALQTGFVKRGGVLRDEERVTSIRPGGVVMLTTSKARTYSCKSLILTAGPWAEKLLRPLGLHLPLVPERIKVLYWKQKQPCHGADQFPTLIMDGLTSEAFANSYGLPCLEYPDHVKMCVHNGPAIDADLRDVEAADDADERALAAMIRNNFPGLEDKPSIKDTCIYTQTPDHHPVLDRHPSWKNIIIGAGFSGHGFKLAPVTGKLLGELATGRTPSFDLTPFAISRFQTSKAAKL